jgi:glycosyltransferase involved in cell wall biosynthesis
MSQKIDISIISSGANIADARLHRLTNALLRQGLTVEIFAPGKASDAPRLASVEIPSDSTSTSASSSDISGEFYPPSSQLTVRRCSSAWTRGKGLLPRYIRSRTFVFRARGTIIYAISPEAFMPALWWVRITRVFFKRRAFAVDIYEDYLRLLDDRAWAKKYLGILGAIARSDTKQALKAAALADLTTVADVQVPPFAARNRLVVRNLPDLSILTNSGERSATPRAIYIGDMRKSRGLRIMLDVAEKAVDWEFDFVGPIAPADQEFVEQWVLRNTGTQALGRPASERVRFHGKLAPRDAWQVAAGAWVGLSLLEQTPAFVEAVPSKLYEYMAVGLATISTPLPRCVELISLSGAGVIADGAEAVAAELMAWQQDPAALDAIRAKASEWAKSNLDSEAEYGRFTAAVAALRG